MRPQFDRRAFLKITSTGVAAFVVGCSSDQPVARMMPPAMPDAGVPITPASPNSPAAKSWTWIEISAENQITIAVPKADMGQGVATSLAMVIAEELDVAWTQVEVVLVPEIGDFYLPASGRAGTAESGSVRGLYPHLRAMGATARAMLTTAAAARLGVAVGELETREGAVIGPDDTAIPYGELVEAAAALTVPADAPLKAPADFNIVGTDVAQYRLDDVVNGARVFGMDIRLDGMKYAAVRQCPPFGGRMSNFDSLTIEGTGAEAIVEIPNGVAVVADSYWTASQVIRSLPVVFVTPDTSIGLNTERMAEITRDALDEEGVIALEQGDVEGALAEAGTTVEAQYEVPYLAHACMEPMVATAVVTDDACEAWLPTQTSHVDRAALAEILSIPSAQVTIHPTYLGTGFGRKIEPDYAIQAALCAKAVGAPVQVIWSREEDLQHDFYRPGFAIRFRGALDDDGGLVGWDAKTAGESILLERGVPLPVDPISVDGLVKLQGFTSEPLPYGIPHQRVRSVQLESPVPVGFWRSVGNSQHAFFVESFIDEAAAAAGADPLAFRKRLLDGQARYLAVLDRLETAADWGRPSVDGAGQGAAFSYAYDSVIGTVAEATLSEGRVRVHRVTCVVDCGTVINPDHVKAQIEGGIIFGLGPALNNVINFEDGRVVESNFHDYVMPVMADVPEITTHLMDSDVAPGGVGELSVGTVAPAIANAVFAATGTRIRRLPIHRALAEG